MIMIKSFLNYQFQQNQWLYQALTHKSFYNENRETSVGNNEKMEFLGDSIINLSVSSLLFKTFPHFTEGDLSKFRAEMVSESYLAKLAKEQGLDKHLLLGKSSQKERQNPRLLASALEAVIAAVYLDSHFEQVQSVVHELFAPTLDQIAEKEGGMETKDFKGRLQEMIHKKYKSQPDYILIDAMGPDHDRVFTIKIQLEGKELAIGKGKKKKEAEQVAAREALKKITS